MIDLLLTTGWAVAFVFTVAYPSYVKLLIQYVYLLARLAMAKTVRWRLESRKEAGK